jgi:folate-binding protein YgfZ
MSPFAFDIIKYSGMSFISTEKPPMVSPSLKGEFQSLLSAAGMRALPRAKLALTGGDRVRWLNGMTTNNVRDLPQGHGVYGLLLNPQGKILGDLYAYQRGDSILLDTDQFQVTKILELFDHYIIMDDVEVTDISDERVSVGILGRKSGDILRAAGVDVPELQPLQFVDLTGSHAGIALVRGDNPLVESYELWIEPSSFEELAPRLIEAGIAPVSPAAMELLRIASGIPRYGQDIRERDLPQETEQARALNFNKGCYIGQEIVERIRSRGSVHRKFSGFTVQGSLPAPGTKIELDGKDIGEITSSAELPTTRGDQAVALGYIRREHAMPGKTFKAGEATLNVADLPFRTILKH